MYWTLPTKFSVKMNILDHCIRPLFTEKKMGLTHWNLFVHGLPLVTDKAGLIFFKSSNSSDNLAWRLCCASWRCQHAATLGRPRRKQTVRSDFST